MSRVHKPHRWQWLWLIPAALLVWWPLWFLFMGALMSQEELRLTIGPALGLGTGYTVWHLLPDLADARTVADPAVGYAAVFCHVLEQHRPVCSPGGREPAGGAPAAWAISRLRFRGRSMVRGLYIVLMLLPFQVTMVPSYLVLRQFGLLDTPWAIILPGIFSTFPVFIMERGFDAIPREVLESASIDGANQWQRFWRIGIPLGIPGSYIRPDAGIFGCLERHRTTDDFFGIFTILATVPLHLPGPGQSGYKTTGSRDGC